MEIHFFPTNGQLMSRDPTIGLFGQYAPLLVMSRGPIIGLFGHYAPLLVGDLLQPLYVLIFLSMR